MAYERIAKRAGRNRGRNSEPLQVSQQGWRGVNYVDNLYEMQPHQLPYAKNVDLGNPIGSISKVAGRESLFASLGAGQIKGLHTWKHPDGDKLIAAWDKYLYLLSGAAGSIAKTSQADWDAGIKTHIDTTTSAGDMKISLAGTNFSETDTLTADFNGTHDHTIASGDKVILSAPTEDVGLGRYYIQNASPSYTPPGYRGAWDTNPSTAKKLSKTKNGDIAYKLVSETSTLDNYDVMLIQAVSDGLASDKTISGTLSWCLGVGASDGAYMYYHVHAWVTQGDSSNVRGTLLTDYIGSVEWPAIHTGLAVGGQAVTPVNALAGDRIVIEIGYRAMNTTSVSKNGYVYYGGTNATDLTDGGDETTYPGWFEFSDFPTYNPSGIYTHTVQNISTAGIANSATITFNKTTPTNTSVTVQTRVSTDGGTTWGSWTTSTSGDTIIASGTNISNYRFQWRATLTGDGTVTPSLDDVTVTVTTSYYAEGSWISPAYDLGNTPLTAVLSWVQTTPTETSVTWYAAGSSDGTVFGDWQAVNASGGAIPLLRYVKIKAVLSGTLSATPTVSSLLINYSNSYSQANRLDISPLGRTNNLLTGNRVSMHDYENRCYCADGLRPFVLYVTDTTVATGTAQSVAGNTIQLSTGASAVDDFYNNAFVTITGGAYAGKTGFISDYVGSTKIATLNSKIFDDSYNFSRGSVAYKSDGTQVATNQPRFEMVGSDQGVVVEEGTTNLLTANQASAETSLDTAWFVSGAGSSVARDTTQYWHGSASVKVITGTGVWDGADLIGNWPVTAGQQYTGSAYVKGNSGGESLLVSIYASDWTLLASTPITLTTAWQRVIVTAIIPTGKTAAFLAFRKNNDASVRTFYVDGIQFEQKSYATSWQLPGNARAPEVLTVPSSVFTKGNWTVELKFTPTSTQAVTGKFGFLWGIYIDANNWYWLLVPATGKIHLGVKYGGTEKYVIGPVLSPGNEYFITATGDGTNLRLFVDGAQYGGDVEYTEPSGTLPANMYIGSSEHGTNQANGIISDFAVMSRAQTLAEHQAEYNSGLPLARDADTTYLANFADPAGTTYSIDKAVKVRKAGVDPPTTAPTLADSGTAGSPNGTYYGKVTFVNAEGYESNPSPASASLSVTSKQITWTVPVDSSAGNTTVSRKLYRTKAGGSVYYYVATINNNTTTTYTDNIADSSLTVLMLDNNNIPPNASLVYEFLTYMFYTYFDQLWFSKAGEPESVPNITGDIQMNVCPGTILDIKANPMALIPMGDNFIAPITTNTGFVFDSDPTVDTTTMRVIDKNGCFSAWASDICISPDLRSILVFPTNTGVRTLLPGLQEESIESIPLSRNVQPYFDRAVNRTNMAGVFFESRYIISFEHMPVGGAKSEYITFVYDFRTSEWYGPWTFGASCYTISDNVLYAGDPEVGKIYRMFTGSSFDGANIEMIADLPMISPQENRTYKFLNFTAMVSSDSNTSQTLVKPKVDSREATIALGTLTDTFTGDTRPGHNNLRTKKHKIPLPRGNTLSYRIYDNSTNPVSVQKIITELEPLPLKK